MRSPAKRAPSMTETFSAIEGCQPGYHHFTAEASGRRGEEGAPARRPLWDIVEEIAAVQGEALKLCERHNLG